MKKNQKNQQRKEQLQEEFKDLEHITSFDWLEIDDDKLEQTNIEPIEINDTFLSWLDVDNDTLELLDDKTKKKVKKKRIGLLLLVISLIIATIFGVTRQVVVYQQTIASYEQEDKPVLQWLRAFVNADFYSCDALSKESEEKLTTTQNEYYVKMLEKVSKAVTNVQITKIVDKNGKICYDIAITYKKYKVSEDKIKEYKDSYEAIEKEYVNNKLTDDEVSEKIRVLYVNTYEQSFLLQSKESTKTYMLYSDKKGVGNIDSFLKELIQDTEVLSVSDKIVNELKSVQKGLQEE